MPAAAPSVFDRYRARVTADWVMSGQAERDRAAQFEEDCKTYPSRVAIAHMEQRLLAKRAKRKAAAQTAGARLPGAATWGEGWRVLDIPHGELESLARNVWSLAFHAIPLPAGWTVRWARLRNPEAHKRTMGRCIREQKLILIDEQNHLGRPSRELIETVAHELVHAVQHPGEQHGERFETTLARVLAYICPEDGPPPPRQEAPMPDVDETYEYATLARDDGTPVPHHRTRARMLKHRAQLDGFTNGPPRCRDGAEMYWTRDRGWHDPRRSTS